MDYMDRRTGMIEAVTLADTKRVAKRLLDAEIVELHLHELAGDLGGGVEPERVGALQIRLRVRHLLLERARFGEAMDLRLDDVDRLTGDRGAGGGAADQHGGVLEPAQAVRDPVGEAALLA